MEVRSVAIGCDHAGFILKDRIKNFLGKRDIRVLDFGTDSADSVDYPDFAHPVANAVEQGEVDLGIVFCGSGNGVAITVNKHQGIRAALCWEPELARLGRAHNNANILALPARFISEELAVEIARTFLESDFEGGRHERRVNKIPLND
jgi:ribose 5-phosphate isomerase B